MYKLIVPINNEIFLGENKEKTLKMLKTLNADRVFLFDLKMSFGERKEEAYKHLKENTCFLKNQGFEVGFWNSSFWLAKKNDYTHIKFTTGNVAAEVVCPSDKKFREFMGEHVKRIAACGVDLIMFDDDYRYGFYDNGLGCVCENHLKYANGLINEKITQEIIDKYIISGSKNKYRSALLKANKHFMLEFARDMRKSLDEINSDVRLGVCSCMSVWDFDGATPIEIAKELAGKTKPFIRLIGAPYWAVKKSFGNRLQDVIEIERMQLSWCEGEEIEIMGEGDAWPRPRHNCPSSYLEGFDTAMRADGKIDGNFKYMFDYYSDADYETGYIKSHLRNEELYKSIDDFFCDKESVGVRVYEEMRKYENMDIPSNANENNIATMFFSPAARMLAATSVPTVYSGDAICGIAFGENIKYVPDSAYKNGLIIDMRAAEILMEKGIDVGMKEANKVPFELSLEYFEDEKQTLYVPNKTNMSNIKTEIYDVKLNENAKIQSFFLDGEKKIPSSYIYENKDGQRFFVFTFDGYFSSEGLYRSYARARQIKRNIKWLSNKNLPVLVDGHPDLYVLCKKKDRKLAAGFWNFFDDCVYEPEILLDKEYKNIRFFGCDGKMDKNKVVLTAISPFGCVGFEVTE